MGYPKDVVTKAWDIIEGRRETAKREIESRRERLRQQLPALAELELRMQETAAGISRSVVVSPTQATQLIRQLADQNAGLQAKREALLLGAGYPADYLVIHYHCPRCEDRGYQGTIPCDCFTQLLRQQAFLELSSVSDGRDASFATFSLEYYPTTPETGTGNIPRKRMEDVYEFCKEYARGFSSDAESLLLLGRTGLGKTHLSLSIAWEVIDRGYGVVYIPVQRLMDRLEANKFSYESINKARYASDMEGVLRCDLLVLDDLGTEFTTSFTTSTLYNIVNTRLVEGRPTIINTNLEPKDLEKQYSQRMTSRLLFGYKPLRFYGEDIRYLRRQKRYKK